MKKNGTYKKSKSEDKFYEFLCEKFDKDDIERQKLIDGHNQPIDFYIKSIDIYIQFDGVYWHGLHKPINILREEAKTSKRTANLYKCYYKDKRQNKWFLKNNLKLVRVTDKEFEKNKDIILEKLSMPSKGIMTL